MMQRFPDWRVRLSRYIVARRATPLVWGRADCCLFVADGIEAMAGVDLAAPLRGYSTALGAARALQREGFSSLADFLNACLPRAPYAREGDIVLLADERLGPVGLADGRGRVWGQDVAGIVILPAPTGAMCWRV